MQCSMKYRASEHTRKVDKVFTDCTKSEFVIRTFQEFRRNIVATKLINKRLTERRDQSVSGVINSWRQCVCAGQWLHAKVRYRGKKAIGRKKQTKQKLRTNVTSNV